MEVCPSRGLEIPAEGFHPIRGHVIRRNFAEVPVEERGQAVLTRFRKQETEIQRLTDQLPDP